MKHLMMIALLSFGSLSAQAALTCQGLSESVGRQTATQVIVDSETKTVRVTIEERSKRRSLLTTRVETSTSTVNLKLTGVKKTASGKDIYVKSGVILKVRSDGEALLVDKRADGEITYRYVSCN